MCPSPVVKHNATTASFALPAIWAVPGLSHQMPFISKPDLELHRPRFGCKNTSVLPIQVTTLARVKRHTLVNCSWIDPLYLPKLIDVRLGQLGEISSSHIKWQWGQKFNHSWISCQEMTAAILSVDWHLSSQHTSKSPNFKGFDRGPTRNHSSAQGELLEN